MHSLPRNTRTHGKSLLLGCAMGALCLFAFVRESPAQVQVDVSFKRSLYLKFEPIIATVTIMNLTGKELYLSDSDGRPWFGFEIISVDNRLVPPRDPNYQLEPIQLGPGQTLTRGWNITPLYAINEYGTYKIRATVYIAEGRRYFTSPPNNIDITEGHTIWKQTVGIPTGDQETGTIRNISLQSLRLNRSTMLYLRIQDPTSGTVYATHQLGKYVNFGTPEIELDAQNNIHVLQNAAPKEFMYTKVDLNGKVLERKVYSETANRPELRKKGGGIVVTGGVAKEPTPQASPGSSPGASTVPTLSDRPVPLPKD